VFIGVGGVLEDNGANTDTPLVFSDDQINTTSGIGFYASLNLSLITLKNNNKTPTNRADDKSYLGLEINDFAASLIGVNPVTISVWNVSVEVNQAKGTGNNVAKLDWNTFFNGKAGMPVAPGSIPHVNANGRRRRDGIDCDRRRRVRADIRRLRFQQAERNRRVVGTGSRSSD
jgi:hypothetical protein